MKGCAVQNDKPIARSGAEYEATAKDCAEAIAEYERKGFPAPEHFTHIKYATCAAFLAAHGPEWDDPISPAAWVYLMTLEAAERNGWPSKETLQGIAMRWREQANIAQIFEANAATLPLLTWPGMQPFPAGAQLPGHWNESLVIQRSALREWAMAHAPHWLDSALLMADNAATDADKMRTESGQDADEPWQEKARAIADELHLKDAAMGAHDSITNIADRVATEMRARDIAGERGPLSGGTIKREALQGGRWIRPQT